MPRLSAPTRKTFIIAAGSMVVGIALYAGWLGIDEADDVGFGFTAAGGLLLALGSIFNRL